MLASFLLDVQTKRNRCFLLVMDLGFCKLDQTTDPSKIPNQLPKWVWNLQMDFNAKIEENPHFKVINCNLIFWPIEVSTQNLILWTSLIHLYISPLLIFDILGVKPKHQSICMRFSYLAKNLQILHWVVLRLRESPFSKEDFCNMYKI